MSMLQEIQEMFPDHSTALINRILQECRGNPELAIARILDTPPDKKSGTTHSSHHHSHHHTSSKCPEHIIPEDFLRWPPNVRTVKVSLKSQQSTPQPGVQPIPSPQDFYSSMPPADYEADFYSGLDDVRSEPAKQGGWALFKSKFSRGKKYQQLT